jgi:hypothetical protein
MFVFFVSILLVGSPKMSTTAAATAATTTATAATTATVVAEQQNIKYVMLPCEDIVLHFVPPLSKKIKRAMANLCYKHNPKPLSYIPAEQQNTKDAIIMENVIDDYSKA